MGSGWSGKHSCTNKENFYPCLGNTSETRRTIIALPENARDKITAEVSITKALDGQQACRFEGLFTRGEFHMDRVAFI